MLAMNFRGPRRVRINHKPMPEILHPQDAIVRVTRSCICGSDLHLYNIHAQRLHFGVRRARSPHFSDAVSPLSLAFPA